MTYLETPQYYEYLNALRMYALSVQNNAEFVLKQLDLLDEAKGTNYKKITADSRVRDYEQILDSLETIFLKTRFTFAVLPMEEERQNRLSDMGIPKDLKTLQIQAKLEKALIWEATTNGDGDDE